MTVDPSRLLQLLEPTVRPGSPAATGGAQQAKPAFENQSFDELLNEAKAVQPGAGSAASDPASGVEQQTNPLAPLGGLVQVENAALRAVLAKAHGSE